MKTILQALIDDVQYPMSVGLLENKLMARGLEPDSDFIQEVALSTEYMGAFADCLYSLIESPNITEADKSISLNNNDKQLILKKINSIYSSIGEDEVDVVGKPMVYFGG